MSQQDKKPLYRPRARNTNPYLLPILLIGIAALVAQMFWLRDNQYIFVPFALDRVNCDACSGLGVVHDPKDDDVLVLCPACFGVGNHYLRRVDGEDRLCPGCVGLGRVAAQAADGSWRTCRRCDGRGLIREREWRTTKEQLNESMTRPAAEKPAPKGADNVR